MSHKGPGLHFPEVTGHWDTQPRPRASPKPPYLAVKPSGEAEQARTGLAAGAGEGAPAGAAPGPDAVGAAAQGPLVAGGGGGRPEEGAPQSGAGGGQRKWLRSPGGEPPPAPLPGGACGLPSKESRQKPT